MEADCWIEFNRQYINYSKTMEYVCAHNKKLRYLIMPGMVVDVMVRLFVKVDQYALRDFVELVAAKTRAAKKVRITSPNGRMWSSKMIQAIRLEVRPVFFAPNPA